jgi:hypothetical protein
LTEVCVVVEEHAEESVEAIADAILVRARQRAGVRLHDDAAVVVLRNG